MAGREVDYRGCLPSPSMFIFSLVFGVIGLGHQDKQGRASAEEDDRGGSCLDHRWKGEKPRF